VATAAQRSHLHALMDLLLRHEPQVHYPPHDVRGPADARTFHLSEQELEHVLASGGGVTMDCSEAVTELCRWAGLRDPNGLGYRYAGYTGTLLAHLPHYADPRAAYVGAIVVFGPGSGQHAAMVYERGADPLLWSHGCEGGPLLVRLSEERRLHSPPVTFLSIAQL
jgi:hypothetical protein